jgi:hypothetical protein
MANIRAACARHAGVAAGGPERTMLDCPDRFAPMPDTPSTNKHPSGFQPYGLSPDGTHLSFGFSFHEGDAVTLQVSYEGLAEIIRYLQHIAKLAQQRRASTASAADESAAADNPLLSLNVEAAADGRFALLEGTTADGEALGPVQLPVEIAEGLLQRLPTIVAQMRTRRPPAPRH